MFFTGRKSIQSPYLVLHTGYSKEVTRYIPLIALWCPTSSSVIMADFVMPEAQHTDHSYYRHYIHYLDFVLFKASCMNIVISDRTATNC